MVDGAGVEPAGDRGVRTRRALPGATEHPDRVHQQPQQVHRESDFCA